MTDDTRNNEHRNFSRIPFDAGVTLKGKTSNWQSKLLDISLKGVLVEMPDDWNADTGESFELEITLAPDVVIDMQAIVAHSENHHVGFRCEHIDLESITHLRRIVELNTGNEDLLHRELSALRSH
jgi:hypothetical protein